MFECLLCGFHGDRLIFYVTSGAESWDHCGAQCDPPRVRAWSPQGRCKLRTDVQMWGFVNKQSDFSSTSPLNKYSACVWGENAASRCCNEINPTDLVSLLIIRFSCSKSADEFEVREVTRPWKHLRAESSC